MKHLILILLIFLFGQDVFAQHGTMMFRRRAATGGYPSELVAFWELEETSGTRVDAHNTNCSGGCDLTDNNTVGSTTGAVGTAADFINANSEYLNRTDEADVSLGSDSDFTICAWINDPLSVNNLAFISKRTNSDANTEYKARTRSNGSFQFLMADGTSSATLTSAASLSADTWAFVCFWHDSTANEKGVQIDDATPTTASWTTGTVDSTGPLAIGRVSGSADYYDGAIDQVALFIGVVLGSTYKTCLYNSGSGRTYADLTTCGTDAGT